MIDIRVTAETPAELHSTLLALLAGTAIAAAGAAPAQTTTRGRGKKADEVQPPTAPGDEGNAGTPGSAGDAGKSTGQSSAAGEVTKDSLSARVLALGAKAGPQVVLELFGEFGASKFSELPADKYGEINTRIDALLAAPAA